VPTNQQRREAERRRLQRQLEERRAREAARKRNTLIGSVIGTLVVIALIVVIAVVATSGSDKKNGTNAAAKDSASSSASPSATTSTSAPVSLPTAPCAKPPSGTATSFKGVTLTGAKDLKHAPKVKSAAHTDPATLLCQDLVVGTGKAATPTSSVSVQYVGVLYKTGVQFDSSWSRGSQPASFSLTGVVTGFKQGIGGAGKVAPMRAGGRRLIILPSALGYGPQANQSIPANSPLVFIVDLKSVSG
jgi:FKBP-type peptidyl-prolyl cis-trans isomerase